MPLSPTALPRTNSPAAAPTTAPGLRANAGSPEASGLLAEALQLQAADHLQEAREKALLALERGSAATRQSAEDLLNVIDPLLVLSPRPMAEKTDYTITPGDNLDKLARKFGTTIDLVRKGNNLPGDRIRVHDRLRVFTGRFSITVDKSDNTLLLRLNDTYFKRYRVGTGQYNKTPVGNFQITDRIAQPTWWRQDGKAIPYGNPENLLGTHWLAINQPGYGIHGTWEPDSIGKQSSAGCIRLVNQDIEELFTLVPIGTPVVIQD